jgi:hypothetical protein
MQVFSRGLIPTEKRQPPAFIDTVKMLLYQLGSGFLMPKKCRDAQ